MFYTNVIDNIKKGEYLTREETLLLLDIKEGSKEYYEIISLANDYSREQFDNKAVVFSQIGLDAQKCDVNCKFCSLAKDNFKENTVQIKDIPELKEEVLSLVKSKTNEIFLMCTANLNKDLYLEYVKVVKNIIPKDMNLVANVGDFDVEFANKLKYTGVTGVYHICRLGEGVDTDVSVQTRINTLNAIKEVGLELYYCVEPIAPKHSNEEIINEIFRAKDYPVSVMAVMKRVAVEDTCIEDKQEITNARLSLIAAATVLAIRPTRAMGVHEPVEICLMSGCNQIYAEVGCNPRDLEKDTKNGRGFSVEQAKKMLKNSLWEI